MLSKPASTALLIALCLLTLGCLFGKLTPMAWLLMYGGWTFLLQDLGRRMLARREAPIEAEASARTRDRAASATRPAHR